MKEKMIACQYHDEKGFVFEGEQGICDLFGSILQIWGYPSKGEERIFYGCFEGKAIRIVQSFADSLDGRANCDLEAYSIQDTDDGGSDRSEKILEQVRINFSKLIFHTGDLICENEEIFQKAWCITCSCIPAQLIRRCLIGSVPAKGKGVSFSYGKQSRSKEIHSLLRDFVPEDSVFLHSALNRLAQESGISDANIEKAFRFSAVRFYEKKEVLHNLRPDELYAFIPDNCYDVPCEYVRKHLVNLLVYCQKNGIELSHEQKTFLRETDICQEMYLTDFVKFADTGNFDKCRTLFDMIDPDYFHQNVGRETAEREFKSYLYREAKDIEDEIHQVYAWSLFSGTSLFWDDMKSSDSRFQLLELVFSDAESGEYYLKLLSISGANEPLYHSLVQLKKGIENGCVLGDYFPWVHDMLYYAIKISDGKNKSAYPLSGKQYQKLTGYHVNDAIWNECLDALLFLAERDYKTKNHEWCRNFLKERSHIHQLVRKEFRYMHSYELRQRLKEQWKEIRDTLKELWHIWNL